MLYKILLSATLVAVPAVAGEVQQGQWEDGAAIAWQCSNKLNIAVKFAFKSKEGLVYQGVLTCGETI